MATGNIKITHEWKKVFIGKTVTLTKDKTGGNEVDFASEVSTNTPSGYTFDHLEFLGVWPYGSWTGAGAVRCYNNTDPETKIVLNSLSTQSFAVRVNAWYYK